MEERHSWLLKEIKIHDIERNKNYNVPCGRWLSLFKDDCKTVRKLPISNAIKSKQTIYDVQVITGNKLGAGTDANVNLTIFGPKRINTGKLGLTNASLDLFERGQKDAFKVHAKNVGKIQKIRIEQDGTGSASDWYLERIIIINALEPNIMYEFNANIWLNKQDGLSVELSPEGASTSEYKISVYTGDVRGAGTDANISCQLFGEEGNTGNIHLDGKIAADGKGRFSNRFERRSVDEFLFGPCPSLGRVNRMKIRHDDSGVSSGWYLEKVIVEDMQTNTVVTFNAQRWLARDEDDGRIEIELAAGMGGIGDVAGLLTVIAVTGKKRYSGTSANVFVELESEVGNFNSGQVQLEGKFSQGSEVKNQIKLADNLSPVGLVTVWHDDSGLGSGWFLDKIIIQSHMTGIEQVFSCNNWLATDEGDGLIKRTLKETSRKMIKSAQPWNLTVNTSDLRNAGTDANVKLTVYGWGRGDDSGEKYIVKSDDIKIDNKSDNFERGKADNFKIELPGDMVSLYKVRVSHDGTGRFSGWHLADINLSPVSSAGQLLFNFPCNKWLAKSEDEGKLIRELGNPTAKDPEAVMKNYHVVVHTGKKRYSGTDANVFIEIHGSYGDTGIRFLEKSANFNKFETGSVDEFTVDAIDLGMLRKIKIGHDNSGSGPGWFLDHVTVNGIDFPCNKWFDKKEDDGQIIRELFTEGTAKSLFTTSYHVEVKTSDVSRAGTNANVHLYMYGESGESGKMPLRAPIGSSHKDKFERGQTDKFIVETEHIGVINRIMIGHDGKNLGSGWHVDSVIITVPEEGKKYIFGLHRWLDTSEGDGKLEVEAYPDQVLDTEIMIPYEVTVYTGDRSGAGTDANVFIQMYGNNGKKTEQVYLENRSDTFERGSVDVFKRLMCDVGEVPMKLRVGHDNKSLGAGWFLDKIVIQKKKSMLTSPANRRRGSLTRNNSSATENISFDTFYFHCNRWLAKDEDDRQTVRELIPVDQHGNPFPGQISEKSYLVKVFTGKKTGAGTDANVYVNISGENGDTGPRKLSKSKTNINKFEAGNEDQFEISSLDLGRLKKIRVGQDTKGWGDAWFLDRIEIENFVFVCQQWLGKGEDDGQVERVLVPISLQEYQEKVANAGPKSRSSSVRDQMRLEQAALQTKFKVNVKTGKIRGAGTDANVYLYLYGDKDDSGKIMLAESMTHSNKFEKGNLDVFNVDTVDIGDVNKIQIGHDGANLGSGWYLEFVELECPSEGWVKKFPAGRWLDSGEADGQLSCELTADLAGMKEYMPKVNYEFSVLTSDIRGAGTNSDVFVVLYGQDGVSTDKMSLCVNDKERKRKFERGQKDVFILELTDVGQTIEKLRIGHDGSGFGDGWHCAKVFVRRVVNDHFNEDQVLDSQDFTKKQESLSSTETWEFEINRWFATSEDDKQIVREFAPTNVTEDRMDSTGRKSTISKNNLLTSNSMLTYTVRVYTSDISRAGTDANVFMTLYGEKGDTGEKELIKSENIDKFERNRLDTFKIEAVDLGRLYKLDIRHDNSGVSFSGADWHLNRIEVSGGPDSDTVFHCDAWLSKDKKKSPTGTKRSLKASGYDGDMFSDRRSSIISPSVFSNRTGNSRTSSAKRSILGGRSTAGPQTEYIVRVITGEHMKRTSKVACFIRLDGNKTALTSAGRRLGKIDDGKYTTDRVPLNTDGKADKFQANLMKEYTIEATDIGTLEEIEFGHDSIDGELFVNRVEIEKPNVGQKYTFVIDSWFSKSRESGQTAKKYPVSLAKISNIDEKNPLHITYYTGDMNGASTDYDVSLTINQKNSDPITVLTTAIDPGSKEHRFTRGVSSTVTHFVSKSILADGLHFAQVALVQPKTKAHRNSTWYLDHVEIEYIDGTVRLECQDWLDAEGKLYPNSQILKSNNAGHAVQQKNYNISVKTSDRYGSGTDANVSIELFGANGSSGELKLAASKTYEDPFERAHVDEFSFSLPDIGTLSRCRVWHDDKGFKSGWHLESITVNGSIFPCNRWLAKDEEDGEILRDLVCSNLDRSSLGSNNLMSGDDSFSLTVTTGTIKGSGTRSSAVVVLTDNQGNRSRKLQLKNGRGRVELVCIQYAQLCTSE